MRNPLRDESAAFRLVFVTIGALGLIVIGSAIATWVGVAVFVALVVLGGWIVWRGRREQPERQRLKDGDGRHRILVVANETVEGDELLDAPTVSEVLWEALLLKLPQLKKL